MVDDKKRQRARDFLNRKISERRRDRAIMRLFPEGPKPKVQDGPPVTQFDQMKSITQESNELQAFENKQLKRE